MPLPWVYCFDLVHVSLASWLNFTIHGCKKRNILHEKKRCRLQNPKNGGVRNKTRCKKRMDNTRAPRKKTWGKVKKSK